MRKQALGDIVFYLCFLLAIVNFFDSYLNYKLTWLSYASVILFAVAAIIRFFTRRNRNG